MGIEKTLKSLGIASKNVVLGFAIFILTMFVAVYGINTFYEKPQYSDFCDELKTPKLIENEVQCVEIGGIWTGYSYDREIDIKGYCDRDFICREEFDNALETYSKNVFVIAVPLGILIIVLGTFIFHLTPVGIGLMFGGVGTLIYGAGGYWRYSENLFKFLISLVGLVVLIFLAYRFNKK